MRKIVIIGNGISGVTCARNIRKQCDDAITIISSESKHFLHLYQPLQPAHV